MNWEDSWMIRYGSGPQFLVAAVVSVLMEESMFDLLERQEWGKEMLFEPMELKLLMLIDVVCLQFLHMICRCVALEDRIEVEMMMPEILMIFATCEELRSLKAIWLAFELNMSWKFGIRAGSLSFSLLLSSIADDDDLFKMIIRFAT